MRPWCFSTKAVTSSSVSRNWLQVLTSMQPGPSGSVADDWRTALKQAALNQLFAQQSYVALPEAVVRRLADDDRRLFSRYHVGLIAVGNDARVEIEAVRNGYFHLRDYRRVKTVLAAAVDSRSPKRVGAVADAIANGSRTLELLQTGPN